jgi:hypothetical protein
LYFIKNNGNQTLGENFTLSPFTGSYNLYGLVDMNSDGWNDLFYQNYSESHWGFMKNNSDLTITDKIIYYGQSSRPYIGDLNSDNLPDIVTSFPDPITDTKIYINNGGFYFSTYTILDIIISNPIIMESNNSIPEDLVLLETPSSNVYFYENLGDANFEFQGNNPLVNSSAIVINDNNDYNVDGYCDICYSQCPLTGCNDSIYISINSHEWSFEVGHSYYIGMLNWFRLKSADLNGDDFPDLFMTGYNSNNKIKILWNNGDGTYSNLNPVSIGEKNKDEKVMIEISPNPFSSWTLLEFSLNETSFISIKIFNLLGIEIKSLLTNQKKSKGKYEIIWDGYDNEGNSCNIGTYILLLEVNEWRFSEKIILQ